MMDVKQARTRSGRVEPASFAIEIGLPSSSSQSAGRQTWERRIEEKEKREGEAERKKLSIRTKEAHYLKPIHQRRLASERASDPLHG